MSLLRKVGGTGPTTRGGLKPGKIINTQDQTEVLFMFNPADYTIKKSNSWKKEKNTGKDVPKLTFKYGNAQTLTLKLHFDNVESGGDVRHKTADLWKMMMVDSTLKNPPPVQFVWGGLFFKAVITDMTEKFTAFDWEGVPARCEVDITLEQYQEGDEQSIEVQLGDTTPSSVTATLAEEARMELLVAQLAAVGATMAIQTAAQAAVAVRNVAENNNIDNPLAIPPGLEVEG